jgi:hypothetical protein
MLYIADGCGSGVIGDTVTFAGDNSTFDGDFVTGQCSGSVTLAGESGTSGGAGGPVSLSVKAGASLKWAVFIYEAPQDSWCLRPERRRRTGEPKRH